MAIAGAFAGLGGALDLLGWEFHLDLTVVQSSQIGFFGIAVALLGRNSAVGIFFASLLFAALLNGTSARALDPSIFDPQLAANLTRIIQGLVVLFVGADLLVIYLWQARRKLRLPQRKPATEAGSPA
jgi:simple sugar transport system permease protein